MNTIPKKTPLETPIRPTPESILLDKDRKWKETETAIEELKSIELIPLVMDIVTAASAGTLKAKDAENAAGPIKVRINKAREILKSIHGLAETPEERSKRVERLKLNIEVKGKSLQKFRDLVGKRLSLPPGEDQSDAAFAIPNQDNKAGQQEQKTSDIHDAVERTLPDDHVVPRLDPLPGQRTESDDVEMMDESQFEDVMPDGIDISGIEDIPMGDIDMTMS